MSFSQANPNAQLLVRTLKFSTGATWVTPDPVNIEDFAWDDLDAGGVTDLGKAFELLAAQLTIPPMTDRALPPVIVLLSDGQPTDDYKKSLDKLLHLPWGKKAVRIAISIGQDADDLFPLRYDTNTHHLMITNPSYSTDGTALSHWENLFAKDDGRFYNKCVGERFAYALNL